MTPQPKPGVPAIILAAGAGQRLGEAKALVLWEGEALLQRAVRMAKAAGCHPILAVVRPGPIPLPELPVQWVPNPAAAEGMASSIRAGLAALPANAPGTLLMTVDQVRVEASLLTQLLDCFHHHPNQPVASAYAGTLGIPAIFPKGLFSAMGRLQGDQGAKGILLQETTLRVAFPGGEDDLDQPEDRLRLGLDATQLT
jgi:CTP:molybdopterin cytidylyltransferase MocA